MSCSDVPRYTYEVRATEPGRMSVRYFATVWEAVDCSKRLNKPGREIRITVVLRLAITPEAPFAGPPV